MECDKVYIFKSEKVERQQQIFHINLPPVYLRIFGTSLNTIL